MIVALDLELARKKLEMSPLAASRRARVINRLYFVGTRGDGEFIHTKCEAHVLVADLWTSNCFDIALESFQSERMIMGDRL